MKTLSPDRGFPHQVRLSQSQDYQAVFESTDCKTSDRYFTLLAKRNFQDDPRLGLAITRKKIRSAVARHAVKRIIRESFRHHKQQLQGLDVIVMASTAASNEANSVLFTQLEKHWQRLSQRCSEGKQ